MRTLWKREPAAIVAAVEAVLALAVAFGLNLSADQTAGILTATGAVLALLVRQTVSSPATVAELEAAARGQV